MHTDLNEVRSKPCQGRAFKANGMWKVLNKCRSPPKYSPKVPSGNNTTVASYSS